jgi:hypothetical protein
MSGRVLQFDDTAHRSADLLLPWLVNGTLHGDELASVLHHVDECPRCQREVQSLRELGQACLVGGISSDPTASLLKLQERLRKPRLTGGIARPVRRLLRRWKNIAPWARWTIAVQFALLLGVGIPLLPISDPVATYRTLGATTAGSKTSQAKIVVMFDSRIRESDLRRIVRDAGSEVIDAPTETGAYVLHVRPEHQRATLEYLHRQSAVVLAEPLGPERKQ